MTKTKYRKYIGGEDWQKRRKAFLAENGECNRCYLPRWLAIIAYDQDLHVHHKSYANLGSELDSDLEPLCKRCHEIETFGKSDLHEVKSKPCPDCGVCGHIFDMSQSVCLSCEMENYALQSMFAYERTLRKLNKIV